MAKMAPPGTGARFKMLAAKLAGKGATDPDALAASIGRKKFGRKAFQMMASAGKKKS